MAFPTASVTGGADAANGTTHTVTLPAVSSGDLLIILMAMDGNPTFTWPAGANDAFTEIFSTANGTAVRLGAAYRICNGSEPGSVNVGTSASEGGGWNVYKITGWHGTTPPEDTGAGTTGLDINPDPDTNTPSWGADDTLFIAVCAYDTGTRTVSAYPTNYSGNQTNNRWNNTAGAGVGSADRNLNGTSDNPGTFTLSGIDDWVATTISVRPAAAGGGATRPGWYTNSRGGWW